MESNNGNRLTAVLLAGALLLSGLMVFPTAAGDHGPDLVIEEFYEVEGSPPPRANTLYEVHVGWKNNGHAGATGVVIGIEDAGGTEMVKSDPIDMDEGESGSLTLQITFDVEGETTPTAIVDYDDTVDEDDEENNEYEGWFNVEPEIGNADVWAALDIEATQSQPGQEVPVSIIFGNFGNVSTATPVTIGVFFDEVDEGPVNWIDPTPLHYGYISPPPPDSPVSGEQFEFNYMVPEDTEDGLYKFTVVADYYDNNTEDNDTANNVDVHEICIGDCTKPDLTWYEQGLETMRMVPPEAVTGREARFLYALANVGEGDVPPGTVVALELEKCPCAGNGWQEVNRTDSIRFSIGAGQIFESESVLAMNWSIPVDGVGDWDVRIVIDPDNNIDESREGNNNRSWHEINDEYLTVIEERPDLQVAGAATNGQAYAGDTIDLNLEIQQSELGDMMAENVSVRLRITDPAFNEYGPYTLGPLDVGTYPAITLFTFVWDIPFMCGGLPCVGDYTLVVEVDPGNMIEEWDETNNLRNDLYIEVKEKLPDLVISEVVVTPIDQGGSAMVGVASTITAVLVNQGLRDMNGGEGADLSVSFSTSAPFMSSIGTVAVGQPLAIGQSLNVSIDYIFGDMATYKVVAKADAADDIKEMDENNNEAYDILPSVTSIDAWVRDVSTTSGLSGKIHPLSFEVGFDNLPASGFYYLFFRVTVKGTGGWGDILQFEPGENFTISPEKPNGESTDWRPDDWPETVTIFLPNTAYLNLTAEDSSAGIMFDWIPDKNRADNYTVEVEIFAQIDVNEDNNIDSVMADIEKLTTDLVIERLTVRETANSVQVIVDVLYPQGEQSSLWDVEVSLKVYDYAAYAAASNSAEVLDDLGTKTINGALSRGSSWSLTFTWAREKGEFIFVAEVDPNDRVREIDEGNNIYPSSKEEFGDVSTGGTGDDEEEGGGLFGIPSISGLAALSLLGTIALLRRRR